MTGNAPENGASYSEPSDELFADAYAVKCGLSDSTLDEGHQERIRQHVGELVAEIETTLWTLAVVLPRLRDQQATGSAFTAHAGLSKAVEIAREELHDLGATLAPSADEPPESLAFMVRNMDPVAALVKALPKLVDKFALLDLSIALLRATFVNGEVTSPCAYGAHHRMAGALIGTSMLPLRDAAAERDRAT